MTQREFVIVIPARFAAARLPGKLLRPIAGRALICHTVRAALAVGAQRVIVATDDDRIAAAVDDYQVEICMTQATHRSGTDRLAEVCAVQDWDDDVVVVNLQGDEPLMPAALVTQCAQLLAKHAQECIATLATPIFDPAQILDPNCVKVVCGEDGRALYFSRAPIPWQRGGWPQKLDATHTCWYRHIGLYAYRAGFLRHWPKLPPSKLEDVEQLEQLRALAHGIPVQIGLTDQPPPPGVDTASDFARVARLWDPT